jgi:FdhD protein
LKPIRPYAITRYTATAGAQSRWLAETIDDEVIVEEPLELWLKQTRIHRQQTSTTTDRLFTTMRTPGDDINLIKGWLLTSGALADLSAIQSITHTGQARLKTQQSNQVLITLKANTPFALAQFQRLEDVNSACGICGQQSIESLLERLNQQSIAQPSDASTPRLDLNALPLLIEQLFVRQTLFQQTGGNHACALFDRKLRMLDVREDVGRHNALDKLIGANADSLFAQSLPSVDTPSQPMGVVLSGRVGFELVQKALMAKLSYVVALGAPSSLAIDLAQEAGLCLIGFIKSQRLNVYSAAHKLTPYGEEKTR